MLERVFKFPGQRCMLAHLSYRKIQMYIDMYTCVFVRGCVYACVCICVCVGAGIPYIYVCICVGVVMMLTKPHLTTLFTY